MYFFFSGEGPTDLGTSDDQPGPLVLVADQIIAKHQGYSFLESRCAVFIHPAELERIKPTLRTRPRSPGLRGLKTPPENRMHCKDAGALAHAATCHIQDKEDKDFVAVLFRDANSPEESEWQNKRNSMLNGFRDQSIDGRGVAAVARPVSEAWWLSAIYRRADANRNCKPLESTAHGGGADHALKGELEEKLKTTPNRTVLNEKILNREIDYEQIDSESFLAFRRNFETAVGLEYLHHMKTTP